MSQLVTNPSTSHSVTQHRSVRFVNKVFKCMTTIELPKSNFETRIDPLNRKSVIQEYRIQRNNRTCLNKRTPSL